MSIQNAFNTLKGINFDKLKQAKDRVAQLELKKLRARARVAEENLLDFSAFVWEETNTVPFKRNWHHGAFSEHAEATLTRQIKRLIVTVPPRCSKTEFFSTNFTPYAWLKKPQLNFGYVTYERQMALDNADKCRSLMKSDLFKQCWGNRLSINREQDSKRLFANNSNGSRFSTSVEAALTGKGFDILVIDDPLNAAKLVSMQALNQVITWWQTSPQSRGNNPDEFVIIVIMQRLHTRDLPGYLLENDADNWVHLNLPAEYDPSCITLGQNPLNWHDPRTEKGELLWPEHLSRQYLDNLKKPTGLGTQNYAAQYNQSPFDKAGKYFKLKWVKRYNHIQDIPNIVEIVQSWDTATTEDEENNCPSVCVTRAKDIHDNHYQLDVFREWVTFNDLVRHFILQAMRVQTLAGHAGFVYPSYILVEDKSSGRQLIQHFNGMSNGMKRVLMQELCLSYWPVLTIIPYTPVTDKKTRALSTAALWEAGMFHLPRNASWLGAYEEETTKFDKFEYTDQVDADSQASLHMMGRKSGYTMTQM